MWQFNRHISNCQINKKKTELTSMLDESNDKKKTKTEWQKMSLKSSMIAKEEKMKLFNSTSNNEKLKCNLKNRTRNKLSSLQKKT